MECIAIKSTCIDKESAGLQEISSRSSLFKKQFVRFWPPEEEEEVGYPQLLDGVIPG